MRGRQKGAPKTGGRKAGTPNKTSAAIREFARSYGRRAIRKLAWLAFNAQSEMVQVAAIKELLDRGYGKAPRPLAEEAASSRVVVTWGGRRGWPSMPSGARGGSEPHCDPLAGLPPRVYPVHCLPPPKLGN